MRLGVAVPAPADVHAQVLHRIGAAVDPVEHDLAVLEPLLEGVEGGIGVVRSELAEEELLGSQVAGGAVASDDGGDDAGRAAESLGLVDGVDDASADAFQVAAGASPPETKVWCASQSSANDSESTLVNTSSSASEVVKSPCDSISTPTPDAAACPAISWKPATTRFTTSRRGSSSGTRSPNMRT